MEVLDSSVKICRSLEDPRSNLFVKEEKKMLLLAFTAEEIFG